MWSRAAILHSFQCERLSIQTGTLLSNLADNISIYLFQMVRPVRLSVKELKTKPEYELLLPPNTSLSIGHSITFTVHRGTIGITRIGKLIAITGSKRGMIGFEVKSLDAFDRGEFILWVPIEAAEEKSESKGIFNCFKA
jgi:hypothetical protein